jgi:hypothetical protein
MLTLNSRMAPTTIFTDSLKPFLYRGPIAPSGTLGMISQAIPLVGDVSEPRVLRTRVGF